MNYLIFLKKVKEAIKQRDYIEAHAYLLLIREKNNNNFINHIVEHLKMNKYEFVIKEIEALIDFIEFLFKRRLDIGLYCLYYSIKCKEDFVEVIDFLTTNNILNDHNVGFDKLFSAVYESSDQKTIQKIIIWIFTELNDKNINDKVLSFLNDKKNIDCDAYPIALENINKNVQLLLIEKGVEIKSIDKKEDSSIIINSIEEFHTLKMNFDFRSHYLLPIWMLQDSTIDDEIFSRTFILKDNIESYNFIEYECLDELYDEMLIYLKEFLNNNMLTNENKRQIFYSVLRQFNSVYNVKKNDALLNVLLGERYLWKSDFFIVSESDIFSSYLHFLHTKKVNDIDLFNFLIETEQIPSSDVSISDITSFYIFESENTPHLRLYPCENPYIYGFANHIIWDNYSHLFKKYFKSLLGDNLNDIFNAINLEKRILEFRSQLPSISQIIKNIEVQYKENYNDYTNEMLEREEIEIQRLKDINDDLYDEGFYGEGF